MLNRNINHMDTNTYKVDLKMLWVSDFLINLVANYWIIHMQK